jgi:hypothetical protein
MNASLNREAEAVAENVYMRLFSRIAQIVGTGIVLPFAFWILVGAAGDLKSLREFQIVTNATLKSMQDSQQKNDQSIGGITERVRNQEEATRQLERSQARSEESAREILTILRKPSP